MTKRITRLIAAIAAMSLVAAMGAMLAGCYIGKAEFRGEEMKMYPFFGGSATAE